MKNKSYALIVNVIVLLATVIMTTNYLRIVDLSLIYHLNQPFFCNTLPFLKSYLVYPQGISDYIGLFLFQFYGNSSVAILLVMLQLALWTFLVHRLIGKYLQPQIVFVPVILSAIPLIMQYGSYIMEYDKYIFTPQMPVIYIITLAFFLFYLKLEKNNRFDFIFYSIILSLTFYITGFWGLLLFGCLSLALNMFKKRWLHFILHLSAAILILIVWLMVSPQYDSFNDIYINFLHNTLFTVGQKYVSLLPEIMFFIFILSLFLGSYFNKHTFKFVYIVAFSVVIVFPLYLHLVYKVSLNTNIKKAATIDRLAYEGKWNEMFIEIGRSSINNPSITQYFYRGLFHKGKLLDYLFNCPSDYNIKGLIVQDNKNISIAIPLSDLYFDMGLINESRHWANEACTNIGWQPRILKRLVETYIIMGKYAVAEKYLNILETSWITRAWAKEHRKFLYCDHCVESTEPYASMRKMTPAIDFFVNQENSYLNLIRLNQPVKNKMAFEYEIACHLLLNIPEEVVNRISDFRKLGYEKLPIICQEAILTYMTKYGDKKYG